MSDATVNAMLTAFKTQRERHYEFSAMAAAYAVAEKAVRDEMAEKIRRHARLLRQTGSHFGAESDERAAEILESAAAEYVSAAA